MAQDDSGHRNYPGFTLLVACALIAVSGQVAPCQTNAVPLPATTPVAAAPPQQMPVYEVATIKPWDGKGFAPPLRVYIQQAFGIPPNTIGWVVGPDWINSSRYVIQAKPPDSVRVAMQTMTPEERSKENHQMMQSLLADRFQFKAHFETREMPVYQLVPAKGGSKLKENADLTKGKLAVGTSLIRGTAAPIHSLIDGLESVPDIGGRKVIDNTGLTGAYDFSLNWMALQTAAASAGESAPSGGEGVSLFTAIEEQLGLKLVPAKAPGQLLVIDHIERPSEN